MVKIPVAIGLLIVSLFLNSTAYAEAYEDVVNNPARSDADRERDRTSKPADILKFIGVQPGMTVADLFSGGGYYTELLSYAVGPTGEVISHNNKAYEGFVGDELGVRFKDNRLANVSQITSEFDNLGLEDASLDMILVVLVYHDVYFTADYWPKVDRDNFFKQIRASLKPGGVLAVIDHSAAAGTGISTVQELHRIDEVFAKQDIEQAGFIFSGSSDVLRNPDDNRLLGVFDEKIRRKTDRFVYRFTKQATE